jgi:very-short-patch-repair endonuclease
LKRNIFPNNPKLKELSKKLRSNMTYSEVKLWNELKNGKVNGYDFDRQRAIGNFIVDFYCKDVQLAIEIDGITHEEEKAKWKDAIRQKELEESGIHFIRFNALLVVNKVEAVVREIANWLEEYEKENGVSEFVKRRREKNG